MKDYRRYKWFYTSSEKLVVGGKSAKQNDELLERIKETGKNQIVMHTQTPGSPFCVIISDIKKVTKKDLSECAIFTGCFSREWKAGKNKTTVDVFDVYSAEKKKGMKTGTWGVKGKVEKVKVELKLVLTKQKKSYRAVPEGSVNKSEALLKICPGRVEKNKIIKEIEDKLNKKIDVEELLAALPAGGFRICQ